MRRLFLFCVGLVLLVLTGCSVALKQNVTLSLQASEQFLEDAHNIERGLCFNDPTTESGATCTNAAGVQAGLNKLVVDPNDKTRQVTQHQAIAVYFDRAFTEEKAAADALPVWKSGDPPPTTVSGYQTDANAVLAIAQSLISNATVQSLIAKAQSAVNSAASIATLVGVK